jgi:hypothetical protein
MASPARRRGSAYGAATWCRHHSCSCPGRLRAGRGHVLEPGQQHVEAVPVAQRTDVELPLHGVGGREQSDGCEALGADGKGGGVRECRRTGSRPRRTTLPRVRDSAGCRSTVGRRCRFPETASSTARSPRAVAPRRRRMRAGRMRRRRSGPARSARRSRWCWHRRDPSIPGSRAAARRPRPSVCRTCGTTRGRSGRTPARARAARKRLRTLDASRTCPVAGCAKTRSWSRRRCERRKWHSSSPASRSAIGTERPRCDLGESNAPRVKLSATRTRPAAQSTSLQRRASSSPWRSPVIAAVR